MDANRIAKAAFEKGANAAYEEAGISKEAVARFTDALRSYADVQPEMNYRPRWAVGSSPSAEAQPQEPIQTVTFDQARPGEHIDPSTAPAEYLDGSPPGSAAQQRAYLDSQQARADQMAYSRPQTEAPVQEVIQAPTQDEALEGLPQEAAPPQSAYDAETLQVFHSAYNQLLQSGYSPEVAQNYIAAMMQKMQQPQGEQPQGEGVPQ